MPARPVAVAFDMIQTVFRLDPLRERLVAQGLPASALELWLARTLRDEFALAASGFYRPFREAAKGTLEGLFAEHGRPPDSSGVSDILDEFAELPAHPDAPRRCPGCGMPGYRFWPSPTAAGRTPRRF